MAKIYGEQLRQSILETKERMREALENRQRRIDNCETDMDDFFISQHIETDALRECDMQLRILDGDGCMDYEAIFDNNGKEVRTHWFQNKWGGYTVVGNGVLLLQ